MIRRLKLLPFALLVTVTACARISAPPVAELQNEDADTVVHDSDGTEPFQLAGPVDASSPITQQAGAWWGDVSTPSINQVWAQVEGVRPDGRVSGNLALKVTAQLPSPTTMVLTSIISQVDSKNVTVVSRVKPGEAQTLVIPTQNFPDGWHEIRIRCKAKETSGPEAGQFTAVTNGYPVYFSNGNPTGPGQNSGTNYVDSHAWYSTDAMTGKPIGYVYAQLNNVHRLIDAPLSGTVPVNGRVRKSGETTIDHWMLKLDGAAVFEFHGSTESRTVNLDTARFSNGSHVLSFHGHGMAASGRQIAAQVNVPIVIQNP